jgi:thiol-disulfide isomerase/thioredoxin
MNRLTRALLFGGVAMVCGLAGLVFYFYQWRVDQPADPVAAGQMLLDAKLLGVNGQVQPFEQWRGKVLVVNFWATWCEPCREEIPGFIEFQERHRARGVQLVGIAIDQKERVVPYAAQMGINYPLVVGGMETMEFARQLGNRMTVLPYTLVVDRAGKVRASQIGILRPEKLELLVRPLL